MIPPRLRPRLQPKAELIPKPDTAKLLMLLEQWTRADVMSRLGPLDLMSVCALEAVKKADEVKMLLYGTCSLMKLAEKFGIK